MNIQTKQRLAHLRRLRIRKKVIGTAHRPRMSVKFTGQHIYVQFVDDGAGATLASTSTRAKGLRGRRSSRPTSIPRRRSEPRRPRLSWLWA